MNHRTQLLDRLARAVLSLWILQAGAAIPFMALNESPVVHAHPVGKVAAPTRHRLEDPLPHTLRAPIAFPVEVDKQISRVTDRGELLVSGVILRDYEPPAHNWLSGHRGIDFAAAQGVAVRATAPGVVSANQLVANKPVVVVKHSDGSRSTFEPVSGALSVGSRVDRGTVIGHTVLASASHCSAQCVHVGLKIGQNYFDPFQQMRGWTRIVLLPTT